MDYYCHKTSFSSVSQEAGMGDATLGAGMAERNGQGGGGGGANGTIKTAERLKEWLENVKNDSVERFEVLLSNKGNCGMVSTTV